PTKAKNTPRAAIFTLIPNCPTAKAEHEFSFVLTVESTVLSRFPRHLPLLPVNLLQECRTNAKDVVRSRLKYESDFAVNTLINGLPSIPLNSRRFCPLGGWAGEGRE